MNPVDELCKMANEAGMGFVVISHGRPCNDDTDHARASGYRCEGPEKCRAQKLDGGDGGFYGVCDLWRTQP